MLDANTLTRESVDIIRDPVLVVPVMAGDDFGGFIGSFIQMAPRPTPEARLREMLGVPNDNERDAA